MVAYPRRWCDVQVFCAGLAMPTRAEDYEVLYTIGTGSYGRCQKIRRKSDGKVSAGSVPVSAPAAVVQTAGGRALCRRREARGLGLCVWKAGCSEELAISPQACVGPGSLKGWETVPFFLFFFNFSFVNLSLIFK